MKRKIEIEVTVCDKCGEQMKEENLSVKVMSHDFCLNCGVILNNKIIDWLKEEIVEQNTPSESVEGSNSDENEKAEEIIIEEKKEPKKANKKVVSKKEKHDWGKACALKKAGWSNAKIADEMGIKLSYLNTQIYQKMKIYDAMKKDADKKAREEYLSER